jgi:hypothetical protein
MHQHMYAAFLPGVRGGQCASCQSRRNLTIPFMPVVSDSTLLWQTDVQPTHGVAVCVCPVAARCADRPDTLGMSLSVALRYALCGDGCGRAAACIVPSKLGRVLLREQPAPQLCAHWSILLLLQQSWRQPCKARLHCLRLQLYLA